ncbi:FAD-binding PCMH-type domain-containing protein [Fusarium sp. LHS14.1]|nr:FAD-binding PCMH-type domain-containing protein [Fusarium sp. LHS14.1]
MSAMRFFTLATLVSASFAQTIKVGGKDIPVDKSAIAPASEAVSRSSSNAKAPLFLDESTQLTDRVLNNLTSLGLSHIELFEFDNDKEETIHRRSLFGQCKTAPGDDYFPSDKLWAVFDYLLGDALQKTVPYASVCYEDSEFGNYNKAKCDYLMNNWFNNSYVPTEDPTAVNAVLYQGQSCLPPSLFASAKSCTVGGYPLYTVDATNVAHIQLTINLARSLNLRLVIKNTGHDFGAKSTGYGALSIWTHNLKSIEVYEDYEEGDYKGPAVKAGAGVQAYEVYEAAKEHGVTLIGGEGQTVGVMGGFIQGGGHGPLSGIHGMASDSVLSFEVVTANGHLVTASESCNPDLFWAIRGGGGGTFGVVTSAVVKAHPKVAVATLTFAFASGVDGLTDEVFWKGVKAFWDRFPEYAKDNGNYEYFLITKTETGYSFSMQPWFAPKFTVEKLKKLVAPLFADFKELGISIKPEYAEFDDFYPAWQASFPLEGWGNPAIRQGSRLFPEENWANETVISKTFDAVKGSIEDYGWFIAFNVYAGHEGYPDTAVNPGWRTALVHGIGAVFWDVTADEATKKNISDSLTNDYIQRWRDVTPGGHAYCSESDYIEPDFQHSFWGSNWERLVEIKEKWDPYDVFYATNGVGSDKWELQDKIFGNLPNQNSKLCRV